MEEMAEEGVNKREGGGRRGRRAGEGEGGGCQVPLMSLGLLLPGPDDDGGATPPVGQWITDRRRSVKRDETPNISTGYSLLNCTCGKVKLTSLRERERV